jgi:hypothetical protein
MKKITFILAIFLAHSFGYAQEPAKYAPYFVSAILKQNNKDATIKIVQGMVLSDSPANAELVFTVIATRQFPSYTALSVLASSFEQLFKSLPRSGEVQQVEPELPARSL